MKEREQIKNFLELPKIRLITTSHKSQQARSFCFLAY